MRIRVLAPTLLLALGALAGCGGNGEPAPASGPGLPSQAELKSYFEAITSGDPAQIATAADTAAPGSLAEDYVEYVAAAATAGEASGRSGDSVEVEEVDHGFQACASDSQCVTWTDLEGKGGKLADFAVNGAKLDTELVDLSGQPPIRAAGVYEVQPEWAYRRPISGALNVVVTITASDVPLTAKSGTYIEGTTILESDKPVGPAPVEAGTSSPVVLPFDGAKDAALDGSVTFDLALGGQGSESIGFGLAQPTS